MPEILYVNYFIHRLIDKCFRYSSNDLEIFNWFTEPEIPTLLWRCVSFCRREWASLTKLCPHSKLFTKSIKWLGGFVVFSCYICVIWRQKQTTSSLVICGQIPLENFDSPDWRKIVLFAQQRTADFPGFKVIFLSKDFPVREDLVKLFNSSNE